jgi:hypothetical protein
MKVMNYTVVMTKTFHPLLVPATLGSLDTLGLAYQALSWPTPNEETTRTCGYALDLGLTTCVVSGHTIQVQGELSHFIPKGRFSEKFKEILEWSSKIAAANPEYVSIEFAPDKILREVKSFSSPFVLYGGGKSLSDELSKKTERDEVATLRQEVDGLKQQVAYLTGLVKLRAEPVADRLAAAKARGASYKTTELANPDNLTLVNASKYAGRSDRVINLERKRGWLYALLSEGNTRGYRYPKWQFDVPTSRLRSVLDVLTSSSLSCWSLHNFLTRPHSDLDGKSPSAALADHTFAIERIIDVARRRVDLQQGAS